jgi:hypothetical protein
MTAGPVNAQFNSSNSNINLNWFENEQLFIQINFANGTGNFRQDNGAAMPTTTPISVQANYNGLVNRQTLTLYAYFADPARAMANGSGGSIPAANIQATIEGVGTAVFNQPSSFSAASVQLATTSAVATNGNGVLPATFSLAILGSNYPAGSWSGTLFLQAQAI